ncbi:MULTISPECIES: hypothetical protein [Virgibacillus]|uniref:hypothetical protein n=1 Tax=Virgibacillus TaxID=84406 RepID=UPI0003882191|nr:MULTISPECIES: hypothetical protein [Virgibacillus]EQB37713.1 hypothetical protein M948_03920 [Virgibacillus sp. CM-4]MYL40449.1 hypothetical protein [Virgibacillus massiliensis]
MKQKLLLFLLYFLSLTSVYNYFQFVQRPIDGNGIGISYLFIMINENVSNHQISIYASSFLIIGLCLFILTLLYHLTKYRHPSQ